MRKARARGWWIKLAMLTTGTTRFLDGCDPSVKATIENGVITTTNSFITALFQALIQLGTEAAQNSV